MKKVKKFLNPMKATLKDYLMNAKKFKILIQKQMLKQERMIAISILKECAMIFLSKKKKIQVKMMMSNQEIFNNIIQKIIQTYLKNKLLI